MVDFNTVEKWVDYIQTLHFREIDMSLGRVRQVFKELCPDGVPFKVVSIAGTNGKGSTAEIISSIYSTAGYRVGKFSSPHLVSFNERFSLNGQDVDDSMLLRGFKAVEVARKEVPITYFEYGLLLSIAVFLDHKTEIAVMEVGLGGRLDAVNVLDADIAVITSIALDHTAWLGNSLEQIAFEKSGIARPNQPCIIGVREPQRSMLSHLNDIDSLPHRIGLDFDYKSNSSKSSNSESSNSESSDSKSWDYDSESLSLTNLPLPFGQDGVQISNASLAIRVTELASAWAPINVGHIRDGISSAQLKGRCQLIQSNPRIVLDVSHNVASVERLVRYVETLKITGRIVVVCGMLKDKEIQNSLRQIDPLVEEWHITSIAGERGSSSEEVVDELEKLQSTTADQVVFQYSSATAAYQAAKAALTSDDCLVVFGSFYVVGDIIEFINH